MVLIRCLQALLIAAWLFVSAHLHAAVVAEVDRLSIGFGETLQLVVRSDQRLLSSSPDTSGLAKDFDILSSSQSTRQSIINGRREISSEWMYTLAPKREGRLHIPPIELAGETTQPLEIDVGPASQASADAAVFLTSELDKDEVYVQQQVVLTLRVYHAVSLGRGANLTEPNLPDAIIKKLNDNEFQTRIDGREYRVFEQKFAIFPQRSGLLDIPQSVLTATIPTRRNSRNLLDPFNANGQTIRLMSEPMQIVVRPQDSRYQGEHWLPANEVIIVDDWNGGSSTLQLGDSATRTITVIADGLLGAQIPPLPIPDIEGLKFYPDQATVSDGEGDKIIGSYTQSYAIIATKAGTYSLPEQRLQWWDSQAQVTRSAILPAQTLTVFAGANTSQAVPMPAPLPSELSLSPSREEADMAEQTVVPPPTATDHDHTVWWLGLAVLTLLWIVTCIIAWQLWRRLAQQGSNDTFHGEDATLKARQQTLYQACQKGDATQVLQAFRCWAHAYTGQPQLDAALAILGDKILRQQIDIVQRGLFKTDAQVDMRNALATIETRVKHLHTRKKGTLTPALAPLYPSK